MNILKIYDFMLLLPLRTYISHIVVLSILNELFTEEQGDKGDSKILTFLFLNNGNKNVFCRCQCVSDNYCRLYEHDAQRLTGNYDILSFNTPPFRR